MTTADFIDLAERVSGKQLDDLFNAWLYTPGKPADPRPAPATSADPAVVARVAASGESTDDPVPHRRR